MSASDASAKLASFGRKTDGSDLLDHAVRVGLVAYGIVHLLIAWLAIQLAFGSDKGTASSKGAMSQLAKQPFGTPLLWIVAFGFFALVLWQGIEAIAGHREKDGAGLVVKRLGSALKAIIFATLGVSALSFAMGGGSGGGGTDSLTAKLMEMPGGQLIVAAVGIGILVYAGRLVYRGASEKFTKHLRPSGQTGDLGRAFVMFGKVGYIAKGVAFFVVGILFLWAAVSHDPKKSGGLDQALHQVLQQPFGAFVLAVIAAGIACYGLFCFAWARHLDR